MVTKDLGKSNLML